MRKIKLLSSILAVSIMLSSLSVTSFADDASVSEIFVSDPSNLVESIDISVACTDVTDTSLAISWNLVPNAESYSVICNNTIVVDGIAANQYVITDLQPGSEFFVSVQAFDAVGSLISESEETVFHTNLTVDSDMKLTENLTVNCLRINDGTLNLNGYMLTAEDDAYITGSSAYVEIGSGSLFINGNLNFENESDEISNVGGLQMTNSKGLACVRGDINLFSLCSGTLSSGTLELCGDFNSNFTGNWDSFNTSSDHKFILSGCDTQTITLPSKSELSIVEVKNFSDGGVVFTNQFSISDLRDNGCNVLIGSDENMVGWTLNKDETFDGNLSLAAGTLDLNGHKLTITGDLLQSGGTVLVNDGVLEVQGDYRLQSSNGVNSGILNMTNDADIVRVSGDFVMQSNQSHDGKLSAGRLEIGGDLIQSGSGSNFYATGNHTVLLCGTCAQAVNFDEYYNNYSRIANLKIENTSEEGVSFGSRVYVAGYLYNTSSPISESSNIYIVSSTVFADDKWNYDVTAAESLTLSNVTIDGCLYSEYRKNIKLGGDVHVKGTFIMDSTVDLNGYTLDVDGDVWMNSELKVNRGRLNVGGDFNICDQSGYPSSGYIVMRYRADYICVNGDMLFYSNNSSSTLSAGTIEIKGDFTQKYDSYENNFYASGNHLVVLSGNDLQRVRFNSNQSRFNVLEVRNTSEAGVEFLSDVKAAKTVTNDCNLHYYDPESINRTLTSDEIIEGDLIIAEGTLDLNGHTLTVTGNLIQSGGTVNINGGTLNVQGDYCIQTTDGYSSKGTLLMTNESDIVKVAGDFVMYSSISHKDCLTNGVLEIGGNFTQEDGHRENFFSSNNHTVILNGSAEQIVSFDSKYSSINNLIITNSSESGVVFKSRVYVLGILYNTESVISQSKNICAGAETVFEDNEWNHSISFWERRVLSDNLKVKGDVYWYAGDLPEDSKYRISSSNFLKNDPDTYTLSVMGDLYAYGSQKMNGGSVFVGGNLYYGSSTTGIVMDNVDDYMLVNGNMYYQIRYASYSRLSKGTIELKGDFIQEGDFRSEHDVSKEFKLVLSGDTLQTIKTESPDFSFSIIDVNNHSDDGIFISSVINYVELRKNGCNVKFKFEDSPGWTLEDDEIIEEDLTISRGILNLNGHKLTVTGDLTQLGGTVLINGGELVVGRDYRIQEKSENGYIACGGILKMKNESDIIRVSGDFVMQSSKDNYYNEFIAGTLEIGGDLLVPKGGSADNFFCSGSHTVVLNGSKAQTVYIYYSDNYIKTYYSHDYSRINNLKFKNTSDEGVTFKGATLVTGKLCNSTSNITEGRNIFTTSSTSFENNIWNGDIGFCPGTTILTPLLIKGDVYAYGGLTVNPGDVYKDDVLGIDNVNSGEYTFLVDGNVYEYETLNLPYYSSMIVSGNVMLDPNPLNGYNQACISLFSNSKLFIGGDLKCSSNQSSSFSSGILEIRGDMIFSDAQCKFIADNNHTTIFSGDRMQTISVTNSNSVFDIIEIKNHSTDGVYFETPVLYTELIDNGCKITQSAGAVTGWTLTNDGIIDGDLNLASGVLDLNGYNLTINGNFIQSGGSVFVNGGELCVSGDYRIQSKRGEEYSSSLGVLKMIDEADIVRVSGSFVMQSTQSHINYLSAGTLEIGGDLVANGLCTSGLHTVVLNGISKQKIEISDRSSELTNLIIRNTSAEGVEIINEVYVTGKLYDTSSKIINGQKLYVTDTTDFVDNAWSADICFKKTPTVLPNFYIGGSLYLDSDLVLSGDMVIEGSLYANSDINLNGYPLEIGENLCLNSLLYVNCGKLYIGNELNISSKYYASSGYLDMRNSNDYVLVNGDVYIDSPETTYLYYGVLEVKGNFTQKNYRSSSANVVSYGKVILSGNNIQKISFEDSSFLFNNLEITKPLDTGYVFNRTPMWKTLVENLTDTESPSAPSKLSFIDSNSTSIRIKWIGSTDNMSDCVYEIYRDGERIAVVSDTEYIDNGLVPHTEYSYYVTACDVSGNVSEPSNTLIAKTNSEVSGLLQPTNLNFKIRSDGSIYLTWSAPVNSDNAVTYNIYRDDIAVVTTKSTSYIDRNTEQGYYEYYVEAVDENSSAVSVSVFVDNMPPAAPVISLGEIGEKRVVLNWTCEDNVGVHHFDLFKNGVLYRTLTNNRYVDTAVSSTNENSYYILAYDAAGNTSQASNTVSFVAAKDMMAPKVTGLDYDFDKVSEANNLIRVSCTDDISLSEFAAEIKSVNSDEWGVAYRHTVSKTSDIVEFSVLDYVTGSGDYDIRITLKDYAGNVSVYEDVFGYVKNELTRPEITADVFGRTVQLKWTAASEASEIKYSLYGRYSYGSYKLVAVTNELCYTISALDPGVTYEYYVVAEDQYGNKISGYTISVKPFKDKINPEIFSVSSSGRTLSDGYNQINFYCSDDVLLDRFTAEVKAIGDSKWTEIASQKLGYPKMEIAFSLENRIKNGGEYELRITVKDSSGNIAVSETKFNYIVNSLAAPEVKVVSDGCNVTVTWDTTNDGTAIEYSVFRVDSVGKRLVACTNGTSYVDHELNPFTEYEYYVVGHDEYANAVSSEICTVTTGRDDIAPTACVSGDIISVAGYSMRFDASDSWDNYGIQSYKWDFGDGSIGVGMATTHIYSDAGTYTVTLTVIDESGNSSIDTTTVTVYDDDYCVAEIQVLDENGKILPGSAAYCDLPDLGKTTYFADDNGVIPLITKSGTYDFYFFTDGYIPLKKSIELKGISTGSNRQQISLTKSELVTADFEYRELGLEEAIDLGIDVTEPENQHLSMVTIRVDNSVTDDKHNFEVEAVVDKNGDFIQMDCNGGFTVKDSIKHDKEITTSQGKTSTTTYISTLGTSLKNNSTSKTPSAVKTHYLRKTIVNMSVTEYSWMKDFYEISVSITNNTDDNFYIDNCSAVINLPKGLSLANTQSEQTISQSIGTINGGETKTFSWIVRADTGGSYPISVKFTGTLEPFGIPIEALLESDEPITVKGNEALKLTLKIGVFKTNFDLTNTASYKVHNVKVDMGSYGEFKDAKRIVLKYPSGMIESIEWEDEEQNQIRKTVYLPVGIDNTKQLEENDYFDLRTLNSHESIVGILYYD